jgi:hypothetical protein
MLPAAPLPLPRVQSTVYTTPGGTGRDQNASRRKRRDRHPSRRELCLVLVHKFAHHHTDCFHGSRHDASLEALMTDNSRSPAPKPPATLPIEGFGLAGYRSFGGAAARFAPLTRVNVLAGQNNSGKSNVLRFLWLRLATVLSRLAQKQDFTLGDNPLDTNFDGTFRFHLAAALHGPLLKSILGPLSQRLASRGSAHLVERAVAALADGGAHLWFEYDPLSSRRNAPAFPLAEDFVSRTITALKAHLHTSELQGLASALGQSGILDPTAAVVAFIAALNPVAHVHPIKVAFIPAIRQIGTAGITQGDFSGGDLVSCLNGSRIKSSGRERQECAGRSVRCW